MKAQGRLATILISGMLVTGSAIGLVATQSGAHAGTEAAASGATTNSMAGMNMNSMAGMDLSSMAGMSTLSGVRTATSQAAGHGTASALAPEQVNLVIVPDALRGSNKRNHDAFLPAYISARAGQRVTVTVYNLDQSPHSFTAPALGLNVILPGGVSDGAVRATTFSFTAPKAGVYTWKCVLPCDNGGVNAWAMTHMGFMTGTITVS